MPAGDPAGQVAQQRALAHPRLAPQHGHPAPAGERVGDKPVERLTLAAASEELGGRARNLARRRPPCIVPRLLAAGISRAYIGGPTCGTPQTTGSAQGVFPGVIQPPERTSDTEPPTRAARSGGTVAAAALFKAFNDERRLDAVEQLIPLAEEAGLRMTHLAMTFAIAHPEVTSAIIGPHTVEQLDDLLAGVAVTLTDDILDRIDEIVPPGTDVGTLDQAYLPRALLNPSLRCRPAGERAATWPAGSRFRSHGKLPGWRR